MISFKLVTLVGSLALLSTCLAQVPPLEDQHYFNGRLEADGDIPFADEMFKVSRTGPSNVGDTANFTCELPAEKSLISNKCFFVTPSNGTYYTVPSQTEEGQVFDDTNTPVPNLTALPSGDLNNICGISIQGLTENYFGKWSCILNDDQVPKHIGDFTMLTKEQLYVRDVRLPLHIVPDHYDVDLFPFIEVGNFTTSGSVQLKFQRVDDPAWLAKDPKLYTKIFLHAKDLAIQEDAITVTNEDGSKSYKIIGHEYGFERDFYIIHLEEELPKNAFFLLNIQFTSYLNDYLTGFYRSRYFDESIQDYKYLAVTQFESHSARLSFPCLDEPDKKATFKVSLTSEPEMTSLSNMPVENTLTTETGHKRTEFQKSVKMSTYLVAFMVSDFSFTQNTQDEAYKIWHQKSKDGQAVLSAENGEKILKFYEDFFDTPYPLPKTDMAAIPDFSAGAMENWGLITYRETLLLFVDGVSDADNRESIIKVMAHELAHQWFGNLVTMKWWTDLWLNEGFATYTQYHGMQHVFNESRARDRMVLYDVQNVFGADSLENSAALSQEVNNPNYDAEFGSIAYSKGCSILRMAENFLTLETFKKGVKKYLSNNRFDNAERDDLWSALTEAATEDNKLPPEISVKDIMDGWTLQAGYPVVKVEKSDGDFIKLSQKRFYINSNVSQESDTKWTIPINVAYPASASSGFDKTTPQEWMLKTGNKLNLEIENRPYVINVQETGFYRVNYDLENWNQLALVLKKDHTKIHEINRAQIIDDSLHLARAKQLSYETALGNTEYLDKEFEYIPWQSALRSFGFIDLMLNDNSSLTEFGYLKTYLTSKLEPLYKKLGFEVSPDDDHITTLTRKFVLSWLCKYDHEECVANSKALFKKWKDEGVNTISADLREVVYGTAIRNGGEEDWDFLWERFLDEKVDSEKQKLIFALGASANENSINKYLTATLTDSIRLQDVIYVYRGIGAFAPGRRFQFEWLQTHWTEIKDHFQARFDGYMVNLVSGYGAASNTEREINILQDFLDERTPDLGNSINDIKRIIETARINLNWMSSNQKTVADWLKSRVEGTTAAPATTTQSSKTTTPSSAAQLSNAFTLIVMLFFFIQHNL